ncbi:MAG: hypothetical protein NTX71_12240 [Candidatus Aureabacteria bacterium]|nr:hypothetical protein [Candidatus Auribacterota bacterium]
MGYSPHIPEHGSGDIDTVNSQGQAVPSPDAEMQLVPTPERKSGCVIYINSGAIGGGDHPHARSLMHGFLYTLTEIAPQPKAIILVGSAVRLAQPGSAAMESLSIMQEQGVQILVAEKSLREIEGEAGITVGKPVTMHAILNALLQAEKVISL